MRTFVSRPSVHMTVNIANHSRAMVFRFISQFCHFILRRVFGDMNF